jgi:hypothetical protein
VRGWKIRSSDRIKIRNDQGSCNIRNRDDIQFPYHFDAITGWKQEKTNNTGNLTTCVYVRYECSGRGRTRDDDDHQTNKHLDVVKWSNSGIVKVIKSV